MHLDILSEQYGIDLADRAVREYVRTWSFQWWCRIYLSHYFMLPDGEFHDDLFDALGSSKPEDELVLALGFRGSAKSTIGSLGLPLYGALENKYHFILPTADTGAQMQLNMGNIKYELDNNELISKDYGKMYSADNWSNTKLLLNNGNLILGRSRGQKIRGMRHRQFRPDLVPIDDPEDLEWTRKKDNRDKTEQWFNSEVLPAVQEYKSKLVVIGNLLHTDALMMRLKKRGIFRVVEFPLVRENGDVTWAAKYPTYEAIKKQRDKVGMTAWLREYLLKIVPEEDVPVAEKEIIRYDNEILKTVVPSNGAVGVDFAIGEGATADSTAMVSGVGFAEGGRDILLILPNPINDKLDLRQTLIVGQTIIKALPTGSKMYAELVAYQRAAVKSFAQNNVPVVGLTPIADKRARYETAAIYIKNGQVRFPQKGVDDLLGQMLNFGVEAHDDLVDALVYLILGYFGDRTGARVVSKAARI